MSLLPARSKPAEETPWSPLEDRRRARDQKREAVLRMAVKMFLEDGYNHTSLSEVATRLNITKPALYNYFAGKEDILAECYRLGRNMYEASIAAIEQGDGDGLDKLRALIRAYAQVITQDFGMCLVRLDDRELAPKTRAEVRRAKRRIDAAFRTQIARGIEDGSIKACDPKLTTFIMTGALNGIGAWFRADGDRTAEAIADEFAERLTEGIATRADGGRKPKPAAGGRKSSRPQRKA